MERCKYKIDFHVSAVVHLVLCEKGSESSAKRSENTFLLVQLLLGKRSLTAARLFRYWVLPCLSHYFSKYCVLCINLYGQVFGRGFCGF